MPTNSKKRTGKETNIPHNDADRRAIFNKLASDWDAKFASAVNPDFLKKIVSKIKLSTGQKALDIGTGTGILIPHLSKAVGSTGCVVAVDFAEKMVEECRRKYADLSNVRIELKNVEELDYPQDFFDAVTCFGMFPHIQNKTKALSNVGNVLKTNGKFMIAHALGSRQLNAMHRKEQSIIAHDMLPSKTGMAKLLRTCGFRVDYFEDQPTAYLCIATKQ